MRWNMSSILWENDGPEDVVASKVLKRAEVGKVSNIYLV